MLRIRKAGNGVISSKGALGSMSYGSILYPLSLGLYLWQMLAAIGETLEKEGDDEVMGVVVNARKGFYRIGLWTKSCTNQEVLKAIGYNPIQSPDRPGTDRRKRFKEVLKLPDQEKVEFNAHSDSERAGGSSRAKTKMVV